MQQTAAPVISNGPLLPGQGLLWLDAPQVAREAQPGQFLLARCSEGYDPLLRRPLSIHRIVQPAPDRAGAIAVLYSLHGAGTAYLKQRRAGDLVDVVAPLGRGFAVHRTSRNLLLLGSGWGLSPLVALAEQQVAAGRNVTLVAGAPSAAQVYPLDLLPPEVEVAVTTEDGTSGRCGRPVDVVEDYWSWADEIYACASMAGYAVLAGRVSGLWPKKPVQILAEVAMACGVGACYACSVETRRGLRLACSDGPRMLLSDLAL